MSHSDSLTKTTNRHELEEYLHSKELVCPMPIKWADLWELMRKDAAAIGVPAPSIDIGPLILAGWAADDRAKNQRFQAQLKYATEVGLSSSVRDFLSKLTPTDWLRFSDS